MYIVDIVKNILEGMTYRETDSSDDSSEGVWKPLNSWQYQDVPTANVKMDFRMKSPTALFMQVTDWTIDTDGSAMREETQINVSFLAKESEIDLDATEQQTIIDYMAEIGKEFLSRLFDERSLQVLDDTITIKSVFLVSDSNRSGVNIQLKLRERQGHCL